MVEVLNLVIVVLLVLANGFFVASEFALVGVRKSRIETLAKAGSRRAKRLLPLVNNLNAYISATQLGITLASLALGWVGAAGRALSAVGWLGPAGRAWFAAGWLGRSAGLALTGAG